jgi:hypothetical protein
MPGLVFRLPVHSGLNNLPVVISDRAFFHFLLHKYKKIFFFFRHVKPSVSKNEFKAESLENLTMRACPGRG